ncbi:MAG: hypothetical protein R3C49_07990 [Planctomycetaceae bacterium]
MLLVFALAQSGCRVYPETHRRDLTQLYHEAVITAQNTPDRNGSMPPAMPMLGSAITAPSTPLPFTPLDPVSLHPVQQVAPSETSDGVILQPVPNPNTSGEERLLPPQSNRSSGWQKSDSRLAPSNGGVRSVSYSAGNHLVTEILEESDVRQALQTIAQQAEISLIVDEQVGGVVTAVIEDEPFESALRKILMPLGFVYRKISDREYIIGTSDPSSPLFSQLSDRVDFRPRHLSPSELVNLVPERDRQFIQAIENRNRILIEAPPAIASQLLQRLQQFDTPIPQVELEAIVCVVAPDHGFRSGLDWGHAVTLNGSELLNIGMAGLALTGKASGAGASNAFSDFAVTSAFVKLLAQEGYLSIRAAPRVTARDGDQAKIAITRESFFSTQPQSDNVYFRQDIQQVQAGIELDITPVVRGDSITVKIEKAEVSEDIRTSQINTGITENPYPQINRRTVTTTVHVRDGETIVIGGLVQRQTVDRIAKVPVLGDVPGLGRLFQTVEQTEQDAEVIIFISPKLVQSDSCPPADSKSCSF